MTAKVKAIEKTSKPESSHLPARVAAQSAFSNTVTTLETATIPQTIGNMAMQQLLRAGVIRAKLSVSHPGDDEEQEADRIAEQVVSSAPVRTVQRKCAACAGGTTCSQAEEEKKIQAKEMAGHVPHVGPGTESSLASLSASGGQPLPPSVRAFFAPRFGQDFSQVRVHASNQAAESARAIQARAFTFGQTVAFANGEYAPHTRAGRKLLAHELAHVAQQQGDSLGPIVQRQAATGGMTSSTAPASVSPPPPAGPIASTPTAADFAGRALIQKALETKDASDVKKIHNFGLASTEEKLKLIDILLNQTWVGPYDEWALQDIWGSWGEYALKIASTEAGYKLWLDCIDRGAELEKLAAVTTLKDKFTSDIKAIVTGYLSQNLQFVLNEMSRLGFAQEEGTEPAPATAQQTEEIQEMQSAASLVAKLQKSREMVVGNVLVGYDANPHSQQPQISGGGQDPSAPPPPAQPMFIPVYFDPLKPAPPLDKDPQVAMFGGSSGKVTPYKTVKDAYDLAGTEIEEWLAGYPALYAIARQGKSAETGAFSKQTDTGAARHQLAVAMRKLIADIGGTQKKLDDGKLELLDLKPVHAQLTGGAVRGPSAMDWSGRLSKSIADDMVRDHDFNNALLALGLEGAATALFLLAPLTGGASFYLLLAGTAVLGGKAYLSAQTYDALAQASKTSITPGTKLVGEDQVERARRAMEADKIAVTLAAIAVGTSAAAAAIGAIGGPVLLLADKAATRAIVASDLEIARTLAQRSLSGPIPEAELLALQEVGLVTRVAQRWANYRNFQVLYRGQAAPTGPILSPVAREHGLPASLELYQKLKDQGWTDQEIANYTARWSGEPVPAFDAPPGMAGQPLGGTGIPATRLPNVAADFAPGPTGVIYVLRVPKNVPVKIDQGGWGAQSAVEQEYVFFHQIPSGYVARTLSPKGIGPLRYDAPPGVGPSLVTPPKP